MKHKSFFTIFITLITIILFLSCDLFNRKPSYNQTIYYGNLFEDNGSMIVHYGNYIYKIGGYDDNAYSNTIYRTNIEENDGSLSISEAVEDTGLPINIAFGAALAVGDFLYVIGGENENGTLDSIYYTQINTDGTLGIGNNKYWAQMTYNLPSPRSHMSAIYYDGRVFLIGGKNDNSIYSSIIHARIQMSHKIGHFYKSPISLEKPLYNTHSLINEDTLYIIGGISNEYISDNIYSFDISNYGLLTETSNIKSKSTRNIENTPTSLINAIFINNGNNLILGGGFNADGTINNNWYNNINGEWSLMGINYNLKAPILAHINNYIISLDHNNEVQTIDLDIKPKQPIIFPGSGIIILEKNIYDDNTVKYEKEIILERNSFSEIKYIVNQSDNDTVTSSSNDYDSPLFISEECNYKFGNYSDSNLTQSENLYYQTYNLGLFVSLTDRLSIDNDSNKTDFTTLNLSTDITSWYLLNVYKDYEISFEMQDSSNNSSYTSNVEYYLVEEDYCTMVLDTSGKPITNTIGNSSIYNIKLTPGTYYLRIDDIDELNGGTIGYLMKEL